MIKNFRHKGLKELFETGSSKGIGGSMRSRIIRQLDVLDAATSVQGVNVPGYQLHPLKGDRKGEWAISVNGNWRITFRPENEDMHDVNLEDYH